MENKNPWGQRFLLFFNGFLLLMFGSINTWQLAHEQYIGSFVVGMFTALMWSYTVTRIVFSHLLDRVFYAFGASLGTIIALELIKLIYH